MIVQVGNTEFDTEQMAEREMDKDTFISIYGRVLSVNVNDAWKQIGKYYKKAEKKAKK